MKVSEMIAKFDNLRPNHIEDGTKREWLSALETLQIIEVVTTHEIPDWIAGHETYLKFVETNGRGTLFDDSSDGELLIPEPYATDVYYWWLAAKTDLIEGNTDKYQNDMQLYNNAMLTYKDWYNRTYNPLQLARSFMRGETKVNVFTRTETDQQK